MHTRQNQTLLQHPSQRGFGLIELMVSMLLSLLLLAGVIAIFISSRTTYERTDQLSRLQENGRFALDTIVRDLRSAGYTGCSKRAEFSSALANANTLLWNFAVPVQGFDGLGASFTPALDPLVATSANAIGDAIVIRAPRPEFEPIRLADFMASETDPVVIESTGPQLIQAGDIVQVSDCQARGVFQVTGYAAGSVAHAAGGGSATAPGNASASAGAAFTENGELVAMRSVVYFLRERIPGSGVTSLYRRQSDSGSADEVVEGVERMQFQFGEDTNNDAEIDVSEYRDASAVTDWNRVLAVRVALLVASATEYGSDRDTNQYQVLNQVVPAAGDRRMRRVFSTTVTLRNAAT